MTSDQGGGGQGAQPAADDWQKWAQPFEDTPAGHLGAPQQGSAPAPEKPTAPVTTPLPGMGQAPGSEGTGGTYPPAVPPARRESAGWGRRILAALLIVLASLAWIGSAAAAWTYVTITDTDRFVAALGPAIEDPVVVDVVSAQVAEEVVGSLGLQGSLSEFLLSDDLAGAIQDSAEGALRDATASYLATPAGQQAWRDTLRASHESIIAVLNESQDGAVTSTDGVVVVQLGPVLEAVVAQAEGLLSGLLGAELSLGTVPDDIATITILESSALADAQDAYGALKVLVWALPVVALLLTVAAVFFARRRIRAVLWVAGLALLGVGVLTVAGSGLDRVAEQAVAEDSVAQAVGNVVGDTFASLRLLAFALVVGGIAVVALLALTRRRGPA